MTSSLDLILIIIFRVLTVKANPAHDRHKVDLVSYIEHELIGRGTFGTVTKATLVSNGQVRAIPIIRDTLR